MTSKTLKRGGFCTDIHFGRKSNSSQHNQDCLDFIDWFCERVKEEKCDYVAFLGDWNENRSALNIATLNYSYKGAKKLNDLGVPVYFVVGNHDLYHRYSREVHSVLPFVEFDNFIVVDHPYVEDKIHNKALFVPYMFHEEYPSLVEYSNIPFWAGHFEFKGFEVTGYGMIMPTGPDPKDFKGPNHIVSGHFHKRQAEGNVVYMGNCFPMDFGDAGDFNRGMMVYDHVKDDMRFLDWKECPKYIKTTLSALIDGNVPLYPNARVKCIVDIPLSFEESTIIRKKYTDDHGLREFVMEESAQLQQALSDTETTIDWDNEELSSVNELVVQMLNNIESDQINNDMLVSIYQELMVEN